METRRSITSAAWIIIATAVVPLLCLWTRMLPFSSAGLAATIRATVEPIATWHGALAAWLSRFDSGFLLRAQPTDHFAVSMTPVRGLTELAFAVLVVWSLVLTGAAPALCLGATTPVRTEGFGAGPIRFALRRRALLVRTAVHLAVGVPVAGFLWGCAYYARLHADFVAADGYGFALVILAVVLASAWPAVFPPPAAGTSTGDRSLRECIRCGYPLGGEGAGRCPECGSLGARPARRGHRGRCWLWRFAAAGVIAACASGPFALPFIRLFWIL